MSQEILTVRSGTIARMGIKKDTLLFAKNFFMHPLRNASIVPSSQKTSDMLLDGVDFSKINSVVELGPGIGNVTEDILRRCKPGTKIVLIEFEESYIVHLKEKFGDKVAIENTSAHLLNEVAAKHGIEKIDLIISTLPILPGNIRLPLCAAIRSHTDRGAVFRFITYIQPITLAIYRDLGVRKISFSFKNFPPVWVDGIN